MKLAKNDIANAQHFNIFTHSFMTKATANVLRPKAKKNTSSTKRKASPQVTVHGISGSPLQKRANPSDFKYASIVLTNDDKVLLTRNVKISFGFQDVTLRVVNPQAQPHCENLA